MITPSTCIQLDEMGIMLRPLKRSDYPFASATTAVRLAIPELVTEMPDLVGYCPLGADEALYFLHILKTAGTSLRQWMSLNFSEDESAPFQAPENFARYSPEVINSKRFIAGHFGTAFGQFYRPPSRTITWLRDPVNRTLSEYFFWRRVATLHNNMPRVILLPTTVDLETCLRDAEYFRTRSNIQTYNLGVSDWDPKRFVLSDEEVLAAAMENLERLEFVGIVERMQVSTDILAWRLGWRPTRFDIYENMSVRDSDISAASKQLLAEMNRLDRQLYDNAYQILQSRFRVYLDEIADYAAANDISAPNVAGLTLDDYETQRAQIESVLWARYHSLARHECRQDRLVFTFDMPLRGDGWGEREGTTGMTSRAFRWMLRSHSTLDLPLKRERELKIRIHVPNSLGHELGLQVDRQVVELKRLSIWERFGVDEIYYEGVLPRGGNWDSQLTTLVFETSQLRRPCDLFENNIDDRKLGVSIDWIEIEP